MKQTMNAQILKKLRQLLGRERCLVDLGERIPYGLDASGYEGVPEAVLLPETAQEIASILKLANAHGFPVTPRGAGSGLTGGAVPSCGGAILSLDRMNRILEIDPDNFLAVIQPGVVTAELNRAVHQHGLFFAPDPASAGFSTIGGNIAENAGGLHAVKYGVTRHSILGLEVVTPTGQIIRTGSKCLKDVVGYGMTELFIGSEGTLGIVTQAVCKLLPLPQNRCLVSAFFPDLDSAAQAVLAIVRANLQPSAMEFMDHFCLQALKSQLGIDPPRGAAAQLLVELDGEAQDVIRRMDRVSELCRDNRADLIRVARDEEDQQRLWHARRSLHGALGKMSPHWHEEDISIPVGRIPAMLKELAAISRSCDLHMANLGHFGDGNIHISYTGAEGPLSSDTLYRVSSDIYRATARLEGRIASEHGVGLAKAEHVGWNLGPETIDVMLRIKDALDPNNILNPAKCFPGARCTDEGHE